MSPTRKRFDEPSPCRFRRRREIDAYTRRLGRRNIRDGHFDLDPREGETFQLTANRARRHRQQSSVLRSLNPRSRAVHSAPACLSDRSRPLSTNPNGSGMPFALRPKISHNATRGERFRQSVEEERCGLLSRPSCPAFSFVQVAALAEFAPEEGFFSEFRDPGSARLQGGEASAHVAGRWPRQCQGRFCAPCTMPMMATRLSKTR